MSADEKVWFLLASMRLARANLQSWSRELDMVGVALKTGAISLPTACDWLDEAGLLRWLTAPQSIDEGPSS